MNIVIIGWYGTETLGDCAILDGIVSVIGKVYPSSKVLLGSLFPFFSARTLYEEKNVFYDSFPGVSIEIFDEKNENELFSAIKHSDLVIMGGGPLCDIPELYIIRKAFLMAEKMDIPRLLMGCGLDYLKSKEYAGVVRDIINYSTGVSFRDHKSKLIVKDVLGYIDCDIDVLGDPALISVNHYIQRFCIKKKDYFAVNFWNAPELSLQLVRKSNDDYRAVIDVALNYFERILLVPMSTFFVGNDDRFLYSLIALEMNSNRIEVCHKPMNLYELYRIYAEAKACFGVRHHAVLMQTVLNGNNYIYDYTTPVVGKTSGFIDSLNNKDYFNDRYYNVFSEDDFDSSSAIHALLKQNQYDYACSSICDEYCSWLKNRIGDFDSNVFE